ncbi:class I SAM-dependent methyltransferase [Nocardioides bigeumensis]|uniref:Class I SAM-dependent methyltransferase n=2 Tax=Nocardioides bigeumensis TaxID=433657 RepID=A0ABP5JAA9_9ACTN
MHRFNARHPWSHNDFFHAWILRRLPESRRRALDIGCGRGALLEQLAETFQTAIGTDLDAGMRREAQQRLKGRPNAFVVADDVHALRGTFDVITVVAVLHHLDARTALADVRRLLAPGGRLLVVGLARPESRVDWAWDVANLFLNPVIGMVLHPRVAKRAIADNVPMPVKDPEDSLDQIRRAFDEVLPGSRVRRRVGFRYTAEWQRTAGSDRGHT